MWCEQQRRGCETDRRLAGRTRRVSPFALPLEAYERVTSALSWSGPSDLWPQRGWAVPTGLEFCVRTPSTMRCKENPNLKFRTARLGTAVQTCEGNVACR